MRKAQLTGRFDASCTTFTGTFKAKGQQARRVQATRGACGDGVLDSGGGEACEGPGGTCAAGSFCAACQCIPDLLAPENTWGPAGEPLPPDAIVLTPEEFMQRARNGFDPVTKAGIAAAEAEEAARIAADRQTVDAAIAVDPRLPIA